jgi:hypothetical protein
MSTHIADFETTDVGGLYGQELQISLTRFFGGTERGPMLQLTMGGHYVALTQKQVKELAELLKNSFDYERFPSE